MPLNRSPERAAAAPAPTAAAAAAAGVLVVLSLAQFLIALDYSIVYIALPSIAASLRLAPALSQWVVSGYAVPFAGFLIVGGRLADWIGARRLFIAASLAFGIASAAGAAAPGGTMLLAARGVQGLAAALLQPAVLRLIGTTFPDGPGRRRALAVWGSVGASGLAAGAILGGLLTSASWRLTFLISVPLTLACALGAAARAGRDPDAGIAGAPRARRLPLRASALATGTVLALVVALTLSSGPGWTAAPTLACFGLAAVALIAFIRGERSAGQGSVLIAPVLRRTPSLRAGAAAAALYMASVGSEFYLLTLLLQAGDGDSPLQAGLAFLPLALMVTAGSTAAGRAGRRLSPAATLAAGFAIAAAGLVWLTLIPPGASYPAGLLPGLLASGFGHGAIYTSMFILGTRDVPSAHQGTAGALLTTAQYLSGAVTIAALTLVLGPAPGAAGFRAAFGVIAAAAVAGLALALASRRRQHPCPPPAAAEAAI
jgi:MFS family permease